MSNETTSNGAGLTGNKAESQGVPMRRAKRQVTDAEQLRSIVDACKTVRVGVVDECGMFIVPMSFGYEWGSAAAGLKLTLWLHSATEGRKARAFADGTRVAIEMDIEDGVITGDYSCSYSYAYRSIMGQGSICAVEDSAAKLKGLGRIMEHMAPGSNIEFSDEVVERVAVWRIDVEQFTGKQRAAKLARG